MRILIFGDSITEGYYDTEKGGWANMLKMHFWEEGNGIEVANLGISGDEVPDVTKRFDIEVKSYTEKYNDEIVFIFSIGINDSVTNLDGTEHKYSKEQFSNNLDNLINQAKKYNPKDFYFIGLTNVDEKLVCPFPWSTTGKCYKNSRILEFDNIIKDKSIENNFNYINIFGKLSDKDLYDGIHPNSKGHEKLFEKIKPNLKY